MDNDLRPLPRQSGRLGVVCCVILLGLAGCGQSGTGTGTPYWLQFDPAGGGAVTQTDKMELKLDRAETSPIAGAQAKVFPPPADAPPVPNAKQADFCVTSAGYCPLATTVPAGENCLCAAGSDMYGGKTGAPPQTMTMRRMFTGPVLGAVPP